ncbi:MAG: multicopper oxidase family protein [Chitinophagaceae bacterium]
MSNQSNTVVYHLEASEFNWEVAPGKVIPAWGFNQQVPAPVLRAKKGDTLIVRIKNNLKEATMVHWHGIRLPASMDGTGEVQKPIEPGAEFEYRFIVPDAGTFWYHSHQNETVQMERGMYGALIIEDETDPQFDNEKVYVIDDMKLNEANQFTEAKGALSRLVEKHDGREGETALINGKENPTFTIHAGQIERWRFINSASARYFRMQLGGHPFQIIGTAGGLLEEPRMVTEILITPGERVDIVAGPFKSGDHFEIEALPYNRVTMLRAKKRIYGHVRIDAPKESTAFVPNQLRRIEPIAPQDARVTRKVKLSVGPNLKRGLDFLVNDKLHSNDLPVRVDELQVWEISNSSRMDHPFHLHGFFFQLLEMNGKAPAYKAWKDTLNLPPRSKAKIAWIPDNRPGQWMYHCHIIEHHAAGMMANFEVLGTDDEVGKYMMNDGHCQHN